jgi:preprotein translocase subunit SecD
MAVPQNVSRKDAEQPHLITRRLTFNAVHEESDKLVADGDPVPDDYELLTDGNSKRLVVSKKPLLEDAVEDANTTIDYRGSGDSFAVDVQLTEDAARGLNDAVTKSGKLRLAVVLDGKVITTPTFREPLTKNEAYISGFSSARQAEDFAILLRSGGIPWPLFLESGHFLK